MLQVLLDCHVEFLGRRPDRAPHIAIVDLKGMPRRKNSSCSANTLKLKGIRQ